jgi:hypothetical protein
MPQPAIVVDVALMLLLGATLFHAIRLERALGVLRRDRAVLEALIQGFNDSTHQAESSVSRLRAAAEGAGKNLAQGMEVAARVRDDLHFLAERGDRLAERLERAVRGARMAGDLAPYTGGRDGISDLDIGHTDYFPDSAPPPVPKLLPPPPAPPMAAAPTGLRVTEDSGSGARANLTALRGLALVDGGGRNLAAPRQRSLSEQALLRALRGGR